ncbi:MAG: serine/threonine protein kinase [Myxococcales bacterium]|nr:serine/threonine protein kinase [Myxococcales bacterium]
MKPGETFAHGKYTLLRKLRSSGMAEVWLARQHGTEGFAKDVVIKRILPHLAEDDKLVTMFLDEARIAANLNHANVVHIFDLGNDGENYFIAMEYIRGYDIEQICEQLKSRNTSFPIEYAVRIIADTCLGLGYAHDCTTADGTPMGVVHRDVSPQNILVSHTGVVKLIDFGIAKARTSSSRTQVGHTKGKICYMSPEQMMARELDRRSDLFSTAVVLYEMLCSTKPFDGDNLLACFHKLMKEGIPAPREIRHDIPPRLEAILMKGLAKDREERYPTAAAFRYEMEGFLRELGISVGPEHLADFLKWLFTPPESTQVVLDVPRVMPMSPMPHTAPLSNPHLPAPMISTQDRISAVNRPITGPNLPTGHNLTPSAPSMGSGFGLGAAEVTVMDDLARQEPQFGFEPTDIAPNPTQGPSFLSQYSSPQMAAPGSSHYTGPELGLPMELEDENPYAHRRRDNGGGGGVWIWALFGFVLLTGAAIAAHYMGWLPGGQPAGVPTPAPPTFRAIATRNTPPPKAPDNPPKAPEKRPQPEVRRVVPPAPVARKQEPRRPPVVRRVRPRARSRAKVAARSGGCPRGGRGGLILDTLEKGQAYAGNAVDEMFAVPNLLEAKRLSAGWHTVTFVWGSGGRPWKKRLCVRRGKPTQYSCELNKRRCRLSDE